MDIAAVIPAYNRRVHVLRAIDSVLAQTVPVGEIIVVDDGSTDGTASAILDRYGSRVSVFTQENAGVSAARNRGIREARGQWIAFLDSDDVWFPTKTERQIEALTNLGGQFGLCFTDNVFTGDPDMKLSVFQQTGFEAASAFGVFEEPAAQILAGREPFFTSSFMVRRTLLEDVHGFDDTLILGEDVDVVFRLSFRTSFCFVTEPLVAVDRTPSRTGLCNLYTIRDDCKYENLDRRYTKWLTMPEVRRTPYERPIRERLRAFRYDSVEAKIHELRVRPALIEIGRLRAMGESYKSVVSTLLAHKLAKIRRGRPVDSVDVAIQ